MNFAIIGASGNVGRKTIEILEKSKIPFQEFSDNTSFMIENAHLFDFNNQFLWITGLTFLIAVTFTNLFHHGNWQRIYAAKDDNTLSVSLIISTLIITP